ncbi:MAG TPA: TIGR02147 family protein [Bdellovibrio sp.]|nr:TIGR02147 family protein [Bdellovibrio sp.]
MARSSFSLRFDKEDLSSLAKAMNYREFISLAMTAKSKAGRKFGYADLARFGGFSARSFPRGVCIGEKNVTLLSLPKFIMGLGLTGDVAEYFRLLVEKEHFECRARKTSDMQINKSLGNLRKRLAAKSFSPASNAVADSIFQIEFVPVVYAALGTPEHGAKITEIISKTGLAREAVISTLEKLMANQIAEKKQGKFFAKENHLNLQDINQSDVFKNFYVHLLERAQAKALKEFSSGSNLHFCSSFSVRERELPKFKDDLRSLLLRYVDSVESSDGDKVVSVVCSMF